MVETPALDLLHAATERLLSRRERYLRQRYGLTPPQFAVLRVVAAQDEVAMYELADRLCCTRGNITGIVDRLERAGLVIRERKPQDHRVFIVRLTAEAEQMVRDMIRDVDELERPWNERLAQVAATLQEFASELLSSAA